jgi:hypothetical protein
MARRFPRFDWLALWILWSVCAQVAGWGLSAVSGLNPAGYAVVIVIFTAGCIAGRGWLREPSTRPLFLRRRSTYVRWLPRAWLALAILAFIGGVFHASDNFDYLTYRFPRVLHWWWDGGWSWLHTPEQRQNLSAVGMEWLMTPLLVLFHTDRLFFLINFVAFLFLPGLVYSVFRQSGVSARVAWSWMWLLPLGFCFILQAASMGNDSFAATYFLASLHYARRARDGAPFALVLSLFSIALVTASKASNIPLVLPWLIVLGLQGRPLLASVRLGLLAGAGVLAVLASFLPMALVNMIHTGSYTGDPTNKYHLQTLNPFTGVVGNALEIGLGNLAPPFWPHDFHWPAEDTLDAILKKGSLRFGFTGVPFQIEETAGVGPGLVLLALLGVAYGARAWLGGEARRPGLSARLLAGAIAVACLGYMAKMGSEAGQRLFAVYYVAGILALLVLFPLDGRCIHRGAWRVIAVLGVAMTIPLVVLNPARPVLPVPWINAGLHLAHVPDAVIEHLDTGYRLRSQRRDELHDLRQAIPASETAIGVVSGPDEPAVSLWLPFGSRETVEVSVRTVDPTAMGLRYVAVSGDRLRLSNVQLNDLLKKWPMTVVAQQPLLYTLRREPETWYLLRADF